MTQSILQFLIASQEICQKRNYILGRNSYRDKWNVTIWSPMVWFCSEETSENILSQKIHGIAASSELLDLTEGCDCKSELEGGRDSLETDSVSFPSVGSSISTFLNACRMLKEIFTFILILVNLLFKYEDFAFIINKVVQIFCVIESIVQKSPFFSFRWQTESEICA